MKRVALALSFVVAAAPARADELEKRGRDVVALDGIAGVAWFTRGYPSSGVDDRTIRQAGVLGTVPFARLGYHRFVLRGLSLGASAQMFVAEHSNYFGARSTVWGIAPRVGYATTLIGATSLWVRGGASILYGTRPDHSFGQISLGGEVVIVTRLHPDFAFTFTSFLESGIAGRERNDVNDVSRPIRLRTIGLSLGVLLAF